MPLAYLDLALHTSRILSDDSFMQIVFVQTVLQRRTENPTPAVPAKSSCSLASLQAVVFDSFLVLPNPAKTAINETKKWSDIF